MVERLKSWMCSILQITIMKPEVCFLKLSKVSSNEFHDVWNDDVGVCS
jgi:hypothetical protein